jgi:serine/threonine protein kinase
MNTNPQHLGKYELQERLGRGGMAEVWKALDTQLHRYVAIKLLHADLQNDPTFMARFLREARIMAALHHPNIVQIHDFQVSSTPDSKDPLAYIVMDFIEGPTLSDYIHNTSGVAKFPSAAEIVNLFLSIGSAVDYAAQHGMVHRDIKPANILLDTQNISQNSMGEPMLTDFGIARLLATSTGVMSGSWLGTLTYASPEQLQGSPGNELSDIYSLGIILYEICTGVLPFQNANTSTIISKHLNEMPAPPDQFNPHISPALSNVIMRCLSKDPRARFHSASALTVALAKALNVPAPESLRRTINRSEIAQVGQTQLEMQQQVIQSSSLASSHNEIQDTPTITFQPQPTSPPISEPSITHLPNNVNTNSLLGERPLSPPNPAIPITNKSKIRPLYLALIATLIVVLAAASLGTFFLLTHRSSSATARQAGGVAFYVSSGFISEGSNQGIEDELQITLHNIPSPDPGKSYYAWLLNDEMKSKVQCHPLPIPIESIFLGKLSDVSGNVSFLYPGDRQHTNLIAVTSRILITEDNANRAPVPPSTNHTTWRYFAEIPQLPSKLGSCFSALDQIRHILSEGVTLSQSGLYGGLNLQFFKNAQRILEWAGSADGAWKSDPALIQRQTIRILELLDGKKFIQKDVPPGTPLLIDEKLAQFPMLQPLAQFPIVLPENYLKRINDQLKSLLQSPAITNQIRQTAMENELALKNFRTWLINIYNDAKQIVKMNNQQLSEPAALQTLNDMQAQANYLFVGQSDPSTGNVKSGDIQMYYSLQQLATFYVLPYSIH